MGSSTSTLNNFGGSTTAEEAIRDVDLTGKVAIVTGANTGIGKETARVLAKHHAHVIMGCRDATRAAEAIADIKKSVPDANVEFAQLRLDSLQSVREFAESFKARNLPLHILINNAGVMATPFRTTEEGFESQIGVNHLGHFLLTNLLLDVLKQSAPSRIVVVSSALHKRGVIRLEQNLNYTEADYNKWDAYAQSKLANILMVKELATQLKQQGITNVTVNALHPGVIPTELGRDITGYSFFSTLGSLFMKSIPQGAATSVYLATAPELAEISGEYFGDCNIADPITAAKDSNLAKQLWDLSVKLVGLNKETESQ